MDTKQKFQQTHDEAVRKAATIQDLTKHEGWKLLMDLVGRLIEQEVAALMGAGVDHKHYRRIGFIQALKYIQSMPELLGNKKLAEYLLHQGRALGFDTFRRMPQYFFEGKAVSQQQMARMFGDGSTPEQYHGQVYNQEK